MAVLGGMIIFVGVISLVVYTAGKISKMTSGKQQPTPTIQVIKHDGVFLPTFAPDQNISPVRNIPATPSAQKLQVTPAASIAANLTANIRADKQLTGYFASENIKPKGKQLWKLKPGKYGVTSDPVIYQGIMYFSGSDGNLYAVNPEDGKTIWTYPMFSSLPLYAQGNILYASDNDGTMHAISLDAHKEIWKFDVDNYKNTQAGSGTGMVMSGITAGEDMIYFSGSNGKLYALDSLTGKLKWKFDTVLSFQIPEVSIRNDIIYATTDEGNLHALEAGSGKEIWRYSIGKRTTVSSPVIANQTAYFVCSDDTLYAVNLENGQLRWKYKYKSGDHGSIGVTVQPVGFYNDKIYLSGTHDNVLEVLNIDGSTAKPFTAGEWVESSASIANGIIYIGSYQRAKGNLGTLYAVDAETLKEIWQFKPEKSGFYHPPLIANGIIYIRDGTGTLYALE